MPKQIRDIGEDNDGVDVVNLRGEMVGMTSMPAFAITITPILPLSSSDQLITQSATEEEQITSAVLKFFHCSNFSSVDSDLMKDSHLHQFWERAHRYGCIPSSLIRGDSLVIEKALVHIKDQVRQYALMVRDSWKTTGCTWTVFNIGKKNGSGAKYLLGCYCPKGLIFVESSDLISRDIRDAWRSHSPSLDIDNVTHFMQHQHTYDCSGDESLFQKVGVQTKSQWFPCLRLRILGACNEICKGVWAQPFIQKAEKIHHRLFRWHLCKWFYNTLNKKGFKQFPCGDDESPVSCFLSVMLLEDELRLRLLHHFRQEESEQVRAEILEILDDYKFWGEGRELQQALTRILKIPDLMDTLVPAAGYLQMAIDKVIHTLSSGVLRVLLEDSFLHSLHPCLNRALEVDNRLAAYLNPVYFLQNDQPVDLRDDVKSTLVQLVIEEEREEIVEQLQQYHANCSNLFGGKNDHPVKLWAQYGHDLPLLSKYAIKVLSQPASCMWNQLKKHIYEVQGTDDYLLRLNLRMMEKFTSLGNDIYKPIDLKELEWRR